MQEPTKGTRRSNANGNDYHDDFECADTSEERAFWKTESMRQMASSRWTNRPPWQKCAVLCVCTIVVVSLIIAVSVSNVKVDRRFADLEKMVANLSAAMTSITSKVHVGKETDQNVYREINKLKFSMEATENQLVSVEKSLKAIDGLEPLKTLVNQLKCNLDKITSNVSTEGCCPLGWSFYSTSCYYFSNEGKSWDSARDSCSRMHASLATLKDDGEWTFVSKHTMPFYFWIGLTDERTGDWEWVDGAPYIMDRRHWKPGQPDDWRHHGLGGGEDCAHLHNDGRLNDDHCSRPYRFVCKASVAEGPERSSVAAT
ncbi:asialoglycoprotein receptor 1 [Scleropages formosus]|uniref:Asialoglycoprotein receptor 1-like n=1 Tax=Scleropages formosus TaxID=113540 RepID=A0A8C9SN88_SCLFO|nr:asialoglycoprotein receptor 1-like [Scleropages formosus]